MCRQPVIGCALRAALAVPRGAGFRKPATWLRDGVNSSNSPPAQAPMIRLDNVSKQHGHQILFIEASATLLKGEKAGLVGPNGAGKSTLSGGWKMRVALARILLMRPDAMLLDEPSNHLDLESLIWLEQFLRAYEGALLMTSHDREFMNRIVNKVVEIDGGQLTSYSGDYEFYEQQRALNEKQQQAQFERQQAMLAKEIKFIERFKARASHAAQVQSRVKKLEKIERVEPPKRRHTVSFDFLPAPRSGEDVVSLKKVQKGYGTRRVYDGLDFMVRRREGGGAWGGYGDGQTTELKVLAGATQ